MMMMEEKGEKKDGLNTSEETISAVESSEEDEEDGSDKIQGNNGDKDKDNKDPLDIGDKKDIIKETSVEEIDSGRALPDYQQALKELAQIADNNRIILDEDDWKDQAMVGTRMKKQSASGKEDLIPTKKLKDDASNKNDGMAKLKKTIHRMSRKELEDFVHETMSACIEGNSEIEKLLERCEIYDQTLDKWKEKSRALHKQCHDINRVMRRYMVDVQTKHTFVTPVKITRSVGLQAVTDKFDKSIPKQH